MSVYWQGKCRCSRKTDLGHSMMRSLLALASLLGPATLFQTATGQAAAVNNFLRAALKGDGASPPSQACFWTELPDKSFETDSTELAFTSVYASLDVAKQACLDVESCRAVSQIPGDGGELTYVISDQRAATPVTSAMSWVHECEDQNAESTLSDSKDGALAARAGSSSDSTNEFFHIKVSQDKALYCAYLTRPPFTPTSHHPRFVGTDNGSPSLLEASDGLVERCLL